MHRRAGADAVGPDRARAAAAAPGRHDVAVAALMALVLAMLGVGLLQSVIATPEAAVETAPVELAAGTALVAIDPAAAAHPRAAEVVGLLDRHFTAINTRDYDTWASTLVPLPVRALLPGRMAAGLPFHDHGVRDCHVDLGRVCSASWPSS